MARRRGHDPIRVERTRTSSVWIALAIAVVFLVLLIIFIAQNNRAEPLHFLGASGQVSEALALLASAVAGAVLVLAVGAARIVQLRLAGRRHNRAARKQAASAASEVPAGSPDAATAQREPQPIEPEQNT
jgi:uncharacterized integral membrane protein